MDEDLRALHLLKTAAEIAVEEQTKEKRRENTQRSVQVIFNGTLAFFSIITAMAVIYQGSVMHDQLTEIRGSSTLNYHLTLNAGVQASAASRQAQNAESSLKATIDNFHLEQRAWVAMTDISGLPEVNKPFDIKLTATNSGKTFAKDFKMVVSTEGNPEKGKPDFSADDIRKARTDYKSVTLLAPGGAYVSTANPVKDGAPLNEADIALVKSSTFSLFIHGRLSYKDVFGCKHWTSFCVSLMKNPVRWVSCDTHNDADDGPCEK